MDVYVPEKPFAKLTVMSALGLLWFSWADPHIAVARRADLIRMYVFKLILSGNRRKRLRHRREGLPIAIAKKKCVCRPADTVFVFVKARCIDR